MLTYALFIATDPHPVSSTDWTHLDQVFDRARLSSGGTRVDVRATEGGGESPDDFDQQIATFINGLHLEVDHNGPEVFSYLADGKVIGTVRRGDGQWQLTRTPPQPDDADPVAYITAADHTRDQAEAKLGKVVEDWLT